MREELPREADPLVDRVRVLQLDLVHRALQALEVLARAQCSAVVDRDHLVDAVAEDEAAVEGRDGDALERHQVAVEVGDARVGGGFGPLHGDRRKRSLRVSQPRDRKPATGTSSSATTGNSERDRRLRALVDHG